MASSGLVGNAITLVNFSRGGIGELSLNDCLTVLREKGDAVNRGDMRAHEAMLSAQGVALNAIFGEFARRAALNMGEHLGAMDTYARLAMKAQSQCRSTIETLAAMKNPPVVFARQANIANGPQQVNNGSCATNAHAGEKEIAPIELLADAARRPVPLKQRVH